MQTILLLAYILLASFCHFEQSEKSENASKTIEFIRKVNASGTTTLYYDESGVFEGAKTLEDFVAYNGSTTVIDWTDEAGTIYGGDLDLNTGVLTSRYASDGSELVDPVEYDLEPVILSTYKGENCIWADAGNMTVNYRADIGLYIDKKTQSGTRSATLSASLTKSESEEKTEENETEGGNNER